VNLAISGGTPAQDHPADSSIAICIAMRSPKSFPTLEELNVSHISRKSRKVIVQTLRCVERDLILKVLSLINDAEATANKKFKAESISFEEHSPANAQYLMLFVFAKLFDRLHNGDKDIGKIILKMEANRLGIDVNQFPG